MSKVLVAISDFPLTVYFEGILLSTVTTEDTMTDPLTNLDSATTEVRNGETDTGDDYGVGVW